MTAPDGYHALTPRIVVADLGAQVQFLRDTFHAEGEVSLGRPRSFESGTRS